MPDQHYTIRVNMKGTAGVVADAKAIKRANREMAGSTSTASRAMHENASASREMSRGHEAAGGSARGLSRDIVDVNARFTAMRNLIGTIKWPALITGAGYAAEGLGAAGSAAIGLTAALAPLAGALVAYPALFGAFAQGAGVMALALGGVMGALGAMETQSLGSGEAAASSGKAIRSASEGVVSAERSLVQSQTTARLAQQGLNVARHEAIAELKDLRNESVSAALGEERATISLREAKSALRKAEAEPSSSGTEIASLELGVREARQSLHESRISSRRAHGEAERASTRGVSHSPKVVESTRSLHEAQQGVRESAEGVAKAERAVGEAMTDSGGAASSLTQKMDALSPSAQKFVKFLYALKPNLDELKQTAGANFLPGVEHGITSALPLFPKLNKAVGETGTVMGHLAEEAGEVVGSKGFGRDFESLTKTNSNVIEHLGGAGLDLADALRQVMVVAEPLVEWMAKSVEIGAQQIDTQTKVGRSTGTLAHFFGETKEVLTEVFSIGSNVAHAFLNIGEAAKPLGDEILASFVDSSESMAKWTDSLEGQNELKEYFADAKPGIFEFGRLVRDATGDIIELSQGEGFFTLTRALRTELLPVMTEVVGQTTEAFGPALIEGLVEVGRLLGNLAGTSGPLTLFVEQVTSMLHLLNSAFDHVPGLKTFVVTLAGIATTAKAMKFVGMVTGFSSALGVARKLLATLGLIEAAQVTGGVVGGAAEVGGAATAGKLLYGPRGEVLTTVGGTAATGAAGGAAGSRGAAAASKLGLLGEAGMITTKGLVVSGVATVAITAGEALVDPDKLGEDPHHEKELHLKGLEFNVGTGKSEAQFLALEKGFGRTMDKLHSDAIVGMGAINRALGTGLDQANETWAQGTPKWRRHTLEAMHAAVKEIEQGMAAGTIKTKEGEAAINRLLSQIHLEKGNDPFGLAEATTKQFKQANEITAGGVASWTKKLEKMPPAAREQTRDATLGMLAAWAQGHPKIEDQVDALTQYEISKFGGAHRAMVASSSGAMTAITESVEEGATNVGKGLENVFDNMAGALTAMGAAKIPHFTVEVLSAASAAHHAREATESGLGKDRPPKKARGGLTTVPGRGREDTVPLTANGSVAAMVAPGEELMVVNRHQRPLLDYAVSSSLGVGGMEGFFGTHNRPHNFAKGGEVKAKGASTPMSELALAALGKASGVSNRYIKSHAPKAAATGAGANAGFSGKLPAGVGTFEGVAVDKWIIPILAWAKAHGWEGGVNSGYRNPAEQMAAAESYGLEHYGPAGPLGSNHVKTAYPGGAVDVSDPEQLAAVLGGYHRRPTLVWGGPVIEDEVHFSATGHARGGIVKRASGGFVGNINHVWAEHNSADGDWGGPTLPSYVVAALAEAAGRSLGISVPGVTMEQATRGESGSGSAGSARPGATGVDPGGTKGLGLWMITTHYNDDLIAQYGGEAAMRNPVPNAAAMASIYGSQGLGAWYGTGSVTGTDTHYTGNYDIRDALGGASFKQALEGKAGTGTATDETSVSVKTSEAEDLPPSFMGCSTSPLSLPTDQPKTLAAVNAEIKTRSGEIHRYAHAAATATRRHKPAIAEALRKNIGLLEQRRSQLEHLKVTLKREVAQKRFTRKVGRRTEAVTGMEDQIEAAQATFNKRGERAEQLVALEPTEDQMAPFHPPPRPSLKGLGGTALETTKKGYEKERAAAETAYEADRRKHEQDFEHGLIGYVQGQEEPAYRAVLGSEAAWRNIILRAEARAAGNWQDAHRPEGLEGNYEGRITKLVENEAGAKSLIGNADNAIAKWRQEHPNAKHLPDALQQLADRREQAKDNLASETQKEAVLRKELGVLRGVFYPGGATITENPTPPKAGSGTFEENLAEVQGTQWPGGHEFLKSLPSSRAAGTFGGAIWETQSVIEELGLKVSSAAAAIAESEAAGEGGWTEAEEAEAAAAEEAASEANALKEAELALLKERNDALEHEAAIHRAQEPVLADYLGAKLGGGVLPKDGYYFGHKGEEITNPDDSRGGASTVTVLEPHIHVSDELAPYITATVEQRFEQGGRKVGLGMSTPTAPGRRASMKGGS